MKHCRAQTSFFWFNSGSRRRLLSYM